MTSMFLAIVGMTTLCSQSLPKLSLDRVSYTEQFYEHAHFANEEIDRHEYASATRLLAQVGYHDYTSETVYNNAVSYLEANDVRSAILSMYQSDFCNNRHPIDPGFGSDRWALLRTGLQEWLERKTKAAQADFDAASRGFTNFEEVDIARGFIEFRGDRRSAFFFWRRALTHSEPPPPLSEANIAAGQLLLHFHQ